MNSKNNALTENLITAFGLDTLDPQKQEEAIGQMGGIVFKKVMLRLAEVLTKEQLVGLEQAITQDEQEPGALLRFLKSEVPQFDELVNGVVAEFKQDMLDLRSSI